MLISPPMGSKDVRAAGNLDVGVSIVNKAEGVGTKVDFYMIYKMDMIYMLILINHVNPVK
jgi:hypothetical protein